MGNLMYNSKSVVRISWWNRVFVTSGRYSISTCIVKTSLGANEARKIAVSEFESIGLYQSCMGQGY